MQDVQVFQIDENGRLIDVLLIPQGTTLTEQIQVGEETVTDEEGNEIVQPIYETRPRQDIVYERPPDSLFEPRWNGESWENGLSQEEIDEIRNQPVPLNPQEQKIAELEQLNIDTMLALVGVFEENLLLKTKNSELEQGQIDTMIALTDVYEQLLALTNGGSE